MSTHPWKKEALVDPRAQLQEVYLLVLDPRLQLKEQDLAQIHSQV